jgi:thiamine transporter
VKQDSIHADLVRLMEASTAVALCVLLGNLRLLELPSGGSISLAAVPLLAYAAARGGRGAVLACWCAGAAHALSGGTIIHPLQFLLDYVIAYGVLALPAAFGATSAARRTLGIVLALALQLAVTTFSGVLFFSSVAGAAAWRYSLSYNAATSIPELVLALLTVPIAIRALQRADPSLAQLAPGTVAHPRRVPRVAVIAACRVPPVAVAAARTASHLVELPRRTPRPVAVAAPPAGAASTQAFEQGRAPLTRPAPFGSTVPWRRANLAG